MSYRATCPSITLSCARIAWVEIRNRTMTVTTAQPAERTDYGSVADYAYAALRREILEGRFPPGRRMREIELASWLGVSRTPTRQALSRLEHEGLVDMRPRIGLVVATLDAAAMEELYEMRGALEGIASALAARHSSTRDVETSGSARGDRSDASGGCVDPLPAQPGVPSGDLPGGAQPFSHEEFYRR